MLELLRPITVRSGDAVGSGRHSPCDRPGPSRPRAAGADRPLDSARMARLRHRRRCRWPPRSRIRRGDRCHPTGRTPRATPSSSGSLLRRSRHRARRPTRSCRSCPTGPTPTSEPGRSTRPPRLSFRLVSGRLARDPGRWSPRSPIGFDRHRTGRCPRHPGGGEPVQTRRSTDRIPVAATRSRRARTARVGHAVTVRSAPNPARSFLPRGSVGL